MSQIKNFIKSNKTLERIARRIQSKKLWNSVHKRVKGTNSIHYRRAILNNVTFDIVGNNNSVEISENCILNNVNFFIRGSNNRIVFDEQCVFSRGGSIWIEDENCLLSVGKQSTFEDVQFALTENNSQIIVGEDCMFANDVDIRTGDSHSIVSSKSMKRLNYAKDVIIENHVWIAAHSTILKGITIKENSVVATRSVVTKSYDQSGVILGGSPAKVIKEDISWLRERIS